MRRGRRIFQRVGAGVVVLFPIVTLHQGNLLVAGQRGERCAAKGAGVGGHARETGLHHIALALLVVAGEHAVDEGGNANVDGSGRVGLRDDLVGERYDGGHFSVCEEAAGRCRLRQVHALGRGDAAGEDAGGCAGGDCAAHQERGAVKEFSAVHHVPVSF